MPNSKKKPLSDRERQDFLDNLPPDQRNPDPKAKLDNLIARASTTPVPKDSAQPPADAGYTDTQTHSRNIEDTSDSPVIRPINRALHL